jgi:hypothetical protein
VAKKPDPVSSEKADTITNNDSNHSGFLTNAQAVEADQAPPTVTATEVIVSEAHADVSASETPAPELFAEVPAESEEQEVSRFASDRSSDCNTIR